MKFNAPLTNAVIFHNAPDIAEIACWLLAAGCWLLAAGGRLRDRPRGLGPGLAVPARAHQRDPVSCPTHEPGIQPEAYGPKPDVDFTQLRTENPTSKNISQTASPNTGIGTACRPCPATVNAAPRRTRRCPWPGTERAIQ
ncbi:hypothetical protein [Streptomyces rugosispiralis]|uniref:Uncharacterized protein n=1 Tax=Streptomyces rugosispiralis TaxID=2967341 RepID=A0ABT1V8M1_9ACTN|nr:hypothetical protein [Streptomyces rugosispiralis]MCQ8193722.1 hypothetical protein [Streptomyces rugosispiralis]